MNQARDIARRAVALLSAPQAKGGTYTVVLDPVLLVYLSMSFRHLSELIILRKSPDA
jgi:TldD protein